MARVKVEEVRFVLKFLNGSTAEAVSEVTRGLDLEPFKLLCEQSGLDHAFRLFTRTDEFIDGKRVFEEQRFLYAEIRSTE